MDGLFFKEGREELFYANGAAEGHAEVVVVSGSLVQFVHFLLVGHCPVVAAFQVKRIGFEKLVAYSRAADQSEFHAVVLAAVEDVFLIVAVAVVLAEDTAGIDRLVGGIHFVQDICFGTFDPAARPVCSIATQVHKTAQFLTPEGKPEIEGQLQVGVIILLVNAGEESCPDDVEILLDIGGGGFQGQPIEKLVAYRDADVPAFHSLVVGEGLAGIACREVIPIRSPFDPQEKLGAALQAGQ